MFFDVNEWMMNSTQDMIFNTKTYRTIRKRIWHDNSTPDGSNDFAYFSFHDLNASQAIAFLFDSIDDAKLVHSQSVGNRWTSDMVDFPMWNELNRLFKSGIVDDRYDYRYYEND